MVRKEFLKSLGLGLTFSIGPEYFLSQKIRVKMNKTPKQKNTNYFEDELIDKAIIIPSGEGESLNLDGLSVTFKVTSDMSNSQLGVYEISLPPKTVGAKLHYHRFMDETFIVRQGVLTVDIGSREEKAEAGAVIYVPRFTPHGFRNDTNKEVILLLIFNPSEKREGFFKGLHETLSEEPVDPKKFLKLYNKYDSYPIDVSNMIPLKK